MSPPRAAISLTNVEEMKEHSFEVGRKTYSMFESKEVFISAI